MNYCLTDIPWTEQPNYRQSPYYATLTDKQRSQVDFYVDKGYLEMEDLDLTETIDIAALRPTIEAKYDWVSNRVQDAYLFCEQVKQIACNSGILGTLKMLYNREPVPFQTLNFINGTEQATHSDFIHFNTIPYHYMCGVWVALEDITLKQGPLHYYEGSHRFGAMDYEKLQINTLGDMSKCYAEYEKKIAHIATQYKYKQLSIKKGRCLIWSSNLLHGGSKVDDRTLSRWTQVTHYLFEDVIPITPMLSLPSQDLWMIRNPLNILTMEPMARSYNGRKDVVLPPAANQRTRFSIR